MYRKRPSTQSSDPSSSTSSTSSNPSTALSKPFKVPFNSNLRNPLPQRSAKKRVSYNEVIDNDGDLLKENKKRKSNKDIDEDYYGNEAHKPSTFDLRTLYPVFKVKPSSEVFSKSFRIPPMKDKQTGQVNYIPLSGLALGCRVQPPIPPKPLHDPMGEHAIVLFDPTVYDIQKSQLESNSQQSQEIEEQQSRQQEWPVIVKNKRNKSLKEILGIKSKEEVEKQMQRVPVVIDPKLSKVLRPHQIEGVKFLYNCTTGLIAENAFGCIMADEMGLGKTLQCIALLWTLVRQSPLPGKPTVEKCIITCPSTLVKNWANELNKWLGQGALNSLTVDNKGTKEQLRTAVKQWVVATGRSVTQPVMIVSYETLRNLKDVLGQGEVGLLLCDEGHKLKNSESQLFKALMDIKCKRRVILSGTPIQNDLSEYFSLLNFANPDYLGDKNEFRRNFENVILRGRDALATEKEKVESEEKLKELSLKVNKFIIRRTNELLTKYLPVKYEHVVFTQLSPLQLSLYKYFIENEQCRKLMSSQPLKAIGILKKLCNHPDLVSVKDDIPGSKHLLPPDYISERLDKKSPSRPEWSGKMMVLMRFLERMKYQTNDKIVLISNYTQTLDLLEKLFQALRWGNLRLDGAMTINKRGKLVERFNDPDSKEFIFLLSSKAGGCGLNLIGANRLILFDPDWNPAADQQALARVWRDGQQKECFVYRFIGTGTLEEQILMRQSYKQTLSACVVDEAEDADRHFTKDTLKELFKYYETSSHMHDSFKCKRCNESGEQKVKANALLYGDVSTWNHFNNECLSNIHDDLLRAETGLPEITKLFQYISH